MDAAQGQRTVDPTAPGAGAPERAVGLRPMGGDDLELVLGLHRSAFPDNVIGRFGGGLLAAYYRTFLDGPHALAVVATGPDGAPVGYLVGVLATDRHRRWVRAHRLRPLLLAGVPALLLHPRLACGVLRRRVVLRLRRRSTRVVTAERPVPAGAAAGPVAVLSHVAVLPEARGAGAGVGLVAHFEVEAVRSGARRLCLATLDEGGAGGLYERRGWQLHARRRTFDGRFLRLYELPVAGAGDAGGAGGAGGAEEPPEARGA
ncbi:GNAT family N-acetyltransferase [Nocardioides sp. ChNu-153]|uniref:GNAT family N-acetyltransferase n=1 Tax=unclassified Nocardioides TaxID=2615069 RepID=UPI0024055F89|nr:MULTISPECIES: GNAT family N-acetyltransferase [unclassified Nocardioides]MDF9714606.1 GNAT family N-acetyltransferase [Nocardioides sp. ChNu-99]MDN7119860.1 GNAT family N-acetyltransferase [Nocardioides sp. ChNu-153]